MVQLLTHCLKCCERLWMVVAVVVWQWRYGVDLEVQYRHKETKHCCSKAPKCGRKVSFQSILFQWKSIVLHNGQWKICLVEKMDNKWWLPTGQHGHESLVLSFDKVMSTKNMSLANGLTRTRLLTHVHVLDPWHCRRWSKSKWWKLSKDAMSSVCKDGLVKKINFDLLQLILGQPRVPGLWRYWLHSPGTSGYHFN